MGRNEDICAKCFIYFMVRSIRYYITPCPAGRPWINCYPLGGAFSAMVPVW
jgi:hypothetical protein